MCGLGLLILPGPNCLLLRILWWSGVRLVCLRYLPILILRDFALSLLPTRAQHRILPWLSMLALGRLFEVLLEIELILLRDVLAVAIVELPLLHHRLLALLLLPACLPLRRL